jgi:hypothetical protein
VFGLPKATKQHQPIHEHPAPKSEKLNLTHQFISLLLVVFVEAGLIEVGELIPVTHLYTKILLLGLGGYPRRRWDIHRTSPKGNVVAWRNYAIGKSGVAVNYRRPHTGKDNLHVFRAVNT